MKLRTLGRSGLRISGIGLGTWGMGGAVTGWHGADDATCTAAIHRALDLGLNFIDTALSYGEGHSERLIGAALAAKPDAQVMVASKIPPKNGFQNARSPETPLSAAFPPEHVIAATEESLRNLRRETLELQQLHLWHDAWLASTAERDALFEAIARLREQGKIRAFGISILRSNPENGVALIESGQVDAVQVIYNIFDQRAVTRLFPLCLERNVGVLARVPLDEGGLTGTITAETAFPEGDFRTGYFQGERKREVAERCAAIVNDLHATDESITLAELPRIALQFALAHPAVTATIPGMRSPRNAERNCAISDLPPLTPEQIAILERHSWARNW
ncbi:aldo/keto reductase [Silvibacterium sp.]|uniref:aldo/keto reductase n=1 Tax=Silvibacterium sp. TaxID=1964179 RepID=UPI0039E28363